MRYIGLYKKYFIKMAANVEIHPQLHGNGKFDQNWIKLVDNHAKCAKWCNIIQHEQNCEKCAKLYKIDSVHVI